MPRQQRSLVAKPIRGVQADIFWGHFHYGRIDEGVLAFITENLCEGVNELAVHPAAGKEELEVLLRGEWKKPLSAKEVKLVSCQETVEAIA